ncbi:MAG TPA: calcium/proton exchanger [Chloroflexota bacterium]
MEASSRRASFSREQQILSVLLVFIPLTLIAARAGWASWLQFFLSVASVVPLAAFIGLATESLAERLGGKIGGLLNATFGNAPDLLIGVFGVQKGLIPLVKATLVGALISNSALIMGICCVVAGLAYGRPAFKRAEAGHHSILMMLAVAAFVFSSVGAIVLCGGIQCTSTAHADMIFHASVGIAIVLLLAYAAYVAYGIFGLVSLAKVEHDGQETRHLRRGDRELSAVWPTWLALLILAGATGALIPITDILTGSVDPVTRVLGWTQVFVGIVIVANAGNAAEAYAAIRFAFTRGGADPAREDSGLDLTLGIASASSVQIATFIAPLIVLYSIFGHRMNLVFSPVELAILLLLTIIFAYICQDGESNWLEGAQLLALYAMAAVVFYTLPVDVFAG